MHLKNSKPYLGDSSAWSPEICDFFWECL